MENIKDCFKIEQMKLKNSTEPMFVLLLDGNIWGTYWSMAGAQNELNKLKQWLTSGEGA